MISGGWLLVSNLVIDSSSAAPMFSVETSYRGIGSLFNEKVFLSKSAMNELRTHLSFSQLRFHCSKQQGRTFHVTTTANSTGEAVVQYFSGQTDVQPDSCGSFLKMDNDDSGLAAVCHKWGTDNWDWQNIVFEVGKWGPPYHQDQDRLVDHPIFVASLYHWLLWKNGERLECDDWYVGVSSGDFWKVFVR